MSIVFGLATSLEASNVTSLRELLSNILEKGSLKMPIEELEKKYVGRRYLKKLL